MSRPWAGRTTAIARPDLTAAQTSRRRLSAPPERLRPFPVVVLWAAAARSGPLRQGSRREDQGRLRHGRGRRVMGPVTTPSPAEFITGLIDDASSGWRAEVVPTAAPWSSPDTRRASDFLSPNSSSTRPRAFAFCHPRGGSPGRCSRSSTPTLTRRPSSRSTPRPSATVRPSSPMIYG